MHILQSFRILSFQKIHVFLWSGLFSIFLAACAPLPASDTPIVEPATAALETLPADSTVDEGSDLPSPEQTMVIVPDQIPPVDTSIHSVPLEEIYFDTFRPVNRAVPLDRADPDLIASLRDAIPPIHKPVYETAIEASWLTQEDIVLGYAFEESARAYPIRILNFHEIVNDVLAGDPILISYCPLCYSGIVYSRSLGENTLTFGNTSALYQSDMVMLDYESGSYWWQVAGKAIVGPLTDQTLTVLPSMMTTWGQWRSLHPETLVLSRNTGYGIDYNRDPFQGISQSFNQGAFAFPVSGAALDERLLPAEIVLAFQLGDQVYGVPLNTTEIEARTITKDGTLVVVFLTPVGPSSAIYISSIDDRKLDISLQGGQFVDMETGSVWDFSGAAVSGPLQGSQLDPVPSKTTFWYALVAAEPEVELLIR